MARDAVGAYMCSICDELGIIVQDNGEIFYKGLDDEIEGEVIVRESIDG